MSDAREESAGKSPAAAAAGRRRRREHRCGGSTAVAGFIFTLPRSSAYLQGILGALLRLGHSTDAADATDACFYSRSAESAYFCLLGLLP